MSGTVEFRTLAIFGDVTFPLILDPIAISPIGPGETYPIDPIVPTDPFAPSDPFHVSFTGIIDSDAGEFTAYFLAPDAVVPTVPPDFAPLIALGSLGGLTSLSMSGPIYAWDDPFQVGTWDITIRVVPEPATLALLGLGLAGLGFARRRKL